MKNTSPLLAAITLAGTLILPASAATLFYAGFQANVDPKTTSEPVTPDSFGWRNPTPAKPLDVDGDNIIGTDGYTGRTSNVAPNVIPSYLTYNQIIGGGNAFGYMDNPLDPTGIDSARVGFQGSTATSADMFSVTIVGSTLQTQTLGLVVQFDTFGSGTQEYILEQRDGGVGGSVIQSVSSGLIDNADDGYDWAFFEIGAANDGDVFVLVADRSGGTAGRITFGEVAFDTAPIPEPSTALLGGLGLLVLLRRRR